MAARAFITGIADRSLSLSERGFLRDAAPWGGILFKRNIGSPDEVRRLVGDIRDALGRDAPILIDQEGGRVQRLGPPHWPVYPPGSFYAALFAENADAGLIAARAGARLMALDLHALGIDVNCLPIADVPVPGADAVIGDRAYGDTPQQVAKIAQAVADGLREGGVLPVLKHIPGHGRANADSHERLPVVEADKGTLETTDFAAFRPLKGLPLAMTAHVVYAAIDPVSPATTSRTVIDTVVRDFIGFDGALMSDDLSMNALAGSLAERARASFAAGCDLALHCNGRMDEMVQVAEASPELTGEAARRADAALAARQQPIAFDVAEAREAFSAMMVRA